MDSGFSSAAWTEYLSRELDAPVEVTYGRARRQVLSAKPAGSGYRVRMHSGFATAPPEVRHATARWLASGRRARKASRVLDDWIDDVLVPRIAADAPARAAEKFSSEDARGEHHDLRALALDVLGTDLAPELLPPERLPAITWGRTARTRARRSLHLGTYDGMTHLVRIHRVLDQAAVPSFFVRFVVFHELLHAAVPARRSGRRTLHHGPEFRRIERAYPDFERAKQWETKHIEALLRSTRTGKPLPKPRSSEPSKAIRFFQRLLFD